MGQVFLRSDFETKENGSKSLQNRVVFFVGLLVEGKQRSVYQKLFQIALYVVESEAFHYFLQSEHCDSSIVGIVFFQEISQFPENWSNSHHLGQSSSRINQSETGSSVHAETLQPEVLPEVLENVLSDEILVDFFALEGV